MLGSQGESSTKSFPKVIKNKHRKVVGPTDGCQPHPSPPMKVGGMLCLMKSPKKVSGRSELVYESYGRS